MRYTKLPQNSQLKQNLLRGSMKKKEAKKMNSNQSIREIHKLKKDLFNMRFKKINGQIQSPAEFNKIKKNIARLYNNVGNKKWQKKY